MRNLVYIPVCICLLLTLCCCSTKSPAETIQTTQKSTDLTQPVDPAVPAPYREVLSDYEKLVDAHLSAASEQDWQDKKPEIPNWMLQSDVQWSNMIAEMASGLAEPQRSSFGYVLKDLDGESEPELFWVRKDGMILAVFTIREQQPVLLDAFWPRYDCVVTEKWELCTQISGGAAHDSYTVRVLDADGTFTTVTEFGFDGFSPENRVLYYEIVDGVKTSVNETRFKELLNENPFIFSADWNALPVTYLD